MSLNLDRDSAKHPAAAAAAAGATWKPLVGILAGGGRASRALNISQRNLFSKHEPGGFK